MHVSVHLRSLSLQILFVFLSRNLSFIISANYLCSILQLLVFCLLVQSLQAVVRCLTVSACGN